MNKTWRCWIQQNSAREKDRYASFTYS